jgi:hypothetical protein
MKTLSLILSLAYLLSGCHRDNCICTPYQICEGNRCHCGPWGEGDSCTPMRNKFIGTYIGYLYLNGANPKADTIRFIEDGGPANYLFSFPNYNLKSYFGIYMRFSRQVNYFTEYYNPHASLQYQDSPKQIDCGVGLLSEDNKTLTLTYLPVVDPGLIDSTNQYTFIGSRQ